MSDRTQYVVTPADRAVPAIRVVATDLVDLGAQVAAHLTRHRRLTRGVPYDAEVGDARGFIRQAGLRQPVAFTIVQEDPR